MNSPLSVNLKFSRVNRVPFFGTRYQSEQNAVRKVVDFLTMKKGGTAKKFINLFAPLAHKRIVESYEGWEGFLYAEFREFS